MHDAPRVAVVNTIHELENNIAGLNLVEGALLFDVAEELATRSILHDHDELFLLNEGVVELDDVFVAHFFHVLRLLEY
jgi:hypothetical protein